MKEHDVEAGFRFEYPIANDPLLIELLKVSGVEVESRRGELDSAKDSIGYAHRLFTHDGDNTPSSADPLAILKEAQAGQSFRCVEYSTLAAGLLWASDMPARTLGLKTSDVETREYGAGHVVIEFWNTDLQKWVMSDVQAGIIPMDEGVPLSAHELGAKLAGGKNITYVPVSGSRFVQGTPYGGKNNYSEWIKEYLYFIDTPIVLTLGNEDKGKQQIVMLVPLGAQNPKRFQNMFDMNAVYTHSVSDFYAMP